MSRTVAEVERSIETHRRELQAALADLRRGVDQGAQQLQEVKQLPAAARARLDREVAAGRARLQDEVAARGDRLTAAAAGTGFVVAGGVGGAVRLPLKLVGISGSGSEIVVRQDRHSRQIGRALAAVAAADRQSRVPRGLLSRSVRRLTVAAPVAAGIAALVSSEERLPPAVVQQRERLLDQIFA